MKPQHLITSCFFFLFFLSFGFRGSAQEIVIPDSQSVFTSYSGNGWFYVSDSVFITKDSLLSRVALEFGLGTSDSLAEVIEVCDSGHCHNKYQQYHKGYPINNCYFSIHTRDDTSYLLSGFVITDLNLSTEINLDHDSAIGLAIEFLSDTSVFFAWDDSVSEVTVQNLLGDTSFTHYPDSAILYYYRTPDLYNEEDSLLYAGEYILSYKVNIQTLAPYTEHSVMVSASDGTIVDSSFFSPGAGCSTGTCDVWYHSTENIYTTQVGSDYYLEEDCNGRKIRTTLDGTTISNTSNTWNTGNNDLYGSLHWASEQVYEYFEDRLGIQSYDGSNTEMVANFNSAFCYGSAFWKSAGGVSYADIGIDFNSTCTGCVPNDPTDVAVELAIIGHEYAHGIVTNYNRVVNQLYKGTIAEAFCDIIGALAFEYVTGSSSYYQLTTNTMDYGSGDYCYRPWDNPNSPSQEMPDTYKGYYWSCLEGFDPPSRYNPYRNTSLITYWFYLLAEGGSGTNDHGVSYDVPSIGLEKAESILFKTIVNQYLGVPSVAETYASYGEVRKATIEVAYREYGKDISETVYDAWRAVGVYSSSGFESYSDPNEWIIDQKEVLEYPFDSRFQTVKIVAGGELVVKSYLNLAENSRFIIEPGGQLTVTGGHIRCDNMDIDFEDYSYTTGQKPNTVTVYVCEPFDGATQGYFYGIEVLGEPGKSQVYSNQGVLLATNAIFEGSQQPLIIVGNKDNRTEGGGIIQATSTTFKNAEILVDFHPYSSIINGLTKKNNSYFINCDFSVDSARTRVTLSSKESYAMVRLNSVHGLKFDGCNFEHSSELTTSWREKGVGILSTNSGFTVQDHCPGTQLPCEEETISSEFNNLFIGVNALEYATPPSPITIKNATFDRALRAIELDGVNGPLIAENTFRNYAHGVYLHGCSDFRVRENTFEYDDFGTRGVTSTSSELPGSEIGYNTFLSNVSPGATFSYLNSDVQLKCNDFSDHTALDILLGSRTFTDQGMCISGEGANNRFNATDDNTHIHINPQVAEPDGEINYSYYRKTGELREPQNIYNGSSTSFFTNDCGVAGTEDQCNPSSTSTGGGFELFFGLKGYVDSLEQLLDGGQTDELAALIKNDQVSDQALADSFSAFDSLLSNATLLWVISQRSDIADSLIFPVLTRNQPLSPIIYRALQYHHPLTDALYDSLLTFEDTAMTYRKQIVHSIDSANVLMNRLYRDIAYTYRENDSIHFLTAFLDTSGLDPVDRAVRKLPLMLGLGFTDSVTQALTDPVFDYTNELNALKTVYQNILDAQDAYLDADSNIDTTYIPIFKALHDTSEAMAGAIAEAFNGGFMGDSLYAEYYETPVVGKRNMQEKPNPESETDNPPGRPLIIPNPNDGSFTIITPSEDWKSLPYQIIDYSGRIVESGVLSEPVTSVTLNNPGIYILVIQNNLGNRYEKFVVQ